MKLDYDERNGRFVLDANDFGSADTVATYIRPVIDELRARPGIPVLIHRDAPTTDATSWEKIQRMGAFDPDHLAEALRGRRIAGVLGTEARYAVGRQFSVIAENHGIDYQPFLSEAEAIAYLEG